MLSTDGLQEAQPNAEVRTWLSLSNPVWENTQLLQYEAICGTLFVQLKPTLHDLANRLYLALKVYS